MTVLLDCAMDTVDREVDVTDRVLLDCAVDTVVLEIVDVIGRLVDMEDLVLVGCMLEGFFVFVILERLKLKLKVVKKLVKLKEMSKEIVNFFEKSKQDQDIVQFDFKGISLFLYEFVNTIQLYEFRKVGK